MVALVSLLATGTKPDSQTVDGLIGEGVCCTCSLFLCFALVMYGARQIVLSMVDSRLHAEIRAWSYLVGVVSTVVGLSIVAAIPLLLPPSPGVTILAIFIAGLLLMLGIICFTAGLEGLLVRNPGFYSAVACLWIALMSLVTFVHYGILDNGLARLELMCLIGYAAIVFILQLLISGSRFAASGNLQLSGEMPEDYPAYPPHPSSSNSSKARGSRHRSPSSQTQGLRASRGTFVRVRNLAGLSIALIELVAAVITIVQQIGH